MKAQFHPVRFISVTILVLLAIMFILAVLSPWNQQSVAKADSATTSAIKLQYSTDARDATSATILPHFIITNNSTAAVNLAELSIRYWYTVDAEKPQNYFCDWVQVGCNNVSGRFVKMTTPVSNADYYYEITFSADAGSLAPGSSLEIQTRFARTDWSGYNQTNDFSFDGTKTAYNDATTSSLYRNGTLIWGSAPVASAAPTATATTAPTATSIPTATATNAPATATAVPTATPTAQVIPGFATVTPNTSNGSFVTRQGSQLYLNGQPFRFAGTNLYWLGLDDNTGNDYPSNFRVDDAFATAKEMGANVVRSHTLGISVGCPKCLMPTLGNYNSAAFERIDYAIASAKQQGIRLIIPLTDQWRYYHGGKHTFTNWRGFTDLPDTTQNAANNLTQKAIEANFYTNPTVINDFKQYVNTILTHRNQYTGLAYKDDPTVMAWETGNEIFDATDQWTQNIAQFIKGIAPNQLVSDGSAASFLHVTPSRLAISALDIVGGHFYPLDTNFMRADALLAQAAGKVYYIGEYPWTDPALNTFLTEVENNKAISGALFWVLIGHTDNSGYVQHGDGYSLHYPGDTSAMQTTAQRLRSSAFKTRGLTVPALGTPSAPLILSVNSGNGITWRGAVGASKYSIERSTAGANGPWTVICNKCADDTSSPWVDSTRPSGAVWYRVQGFNLNGVGGTYSPVFQPVVSNASTLVDEMVDWSKTYSHSQNLWFDTSNSASFDGDGSRAVRGKTTNEEIVWNKANMRSFEATTYFWPDEAVSPFSVYTSADGVNWTQVNPTISSTSGNWSKYVYTLTNLSNVNFVKMRWNNTTGNFWNPQIGKVVISY